MNLSADQLAELIAGVARAQNAIVEAVDRANAGWRNTHFIPTLNIAANMRSADPRLLDLPSRVLLRLQGRGLVDYEAIKADLVRLIGPDTQWPVQAGTGLLPAAAVLSGAAEAPAGAPEAEPADSAAEAPPPPPMSEEELFDFLKKI